MSSASTAPNHQTNGRPRPLSALRQARAETVLKQLAFNAEFNLSNYLSDVYRAAGWKGLSRRQVDEAIEALVAAGQAVVVGRSGGVEVQLTDPPPSWRGRPSA